MGGAIQVKWWLSCKSQCFGLNTRQSFSLNNCLSAMTEFPMIPNDYV